MAAMRIRPINIYGKTFFNLFQFAIKAIKVVFDDCELSTTDIKFAIPAILIVPGEPEKIVIVNSRMNLRQVIKIGSVLFILYDPFIGQIL